MSDSVQPHRWQPTRLCRPWDSPGKNTGVGCHCLLQRMKVKSESEVTQSCPTLSDPMDCSPPGSSVHGIFQARILGWGAIAFSPRLPGNPQNFYPYPNAHGLSLRQESRNTFIWGHTPQAPPCALPASPQVPRAMVSLPRLLIETALASAT